MGPFPIAHGEFLFCVWNKRFLLEICRNLILWNVFLCDPLGQRNEPQGFLCNGSFKRKFGEIKTNYTRSNFLEIFRCLLKKENISPNSCFFFFLWSIQTTIWGDRCVFFPGRNSLDIPTPSMWLFYSCVFQFLQDLTRMSPPTLLPIISLINTHIYINWYI